MQMQMMNGAYEKTEGLDGGAEAGVILGGALNGIATVTAFNMQRSTAEQYNKVRSVGASKPRDLMANNRCMEM